MRLFLVYMFLPFYLKAQVITTYVGNGVSGYSGNGGLATASCISIPMGLTIDLNGDLLVCQHMLVRKIDCTTGIITTIAGSDTATSAGHGGDGGIATNAQLVEPYAVSVDANNNLYITDYWYYEVRKVMSSTGIIDTFAGNRSTGGTGDGGLAKRATFNSVFGLCVDTFRNVIYISDEWGARVRKVDMSSMIISAFAGSGSSGYSGDGGLATAAKFSRVLGLAIDKHGNVYIGDWDNGRIRKVDAVTKIITTVVGNGIVGYSGDGGLATNAKIDKPTAICFDSCGNLYFSDENNNRVRKVDLTTGIINTIAGNGTPGFSGDGGLPTLAQLNHPTGICVDKNNNLFIADYFNHRVRKISNLTSCLTLSETFPEESDEISAFPNPANSKIEIVNNHSGESDFIITDVFGQVVLKRKLTKKQETIYIDTFPVGVYVLTLTSNDGRKKILRLIKI